MPYHLQLEHVTYNQQFPYGGKYFKSKQMPFKPKACGDQIFKKYQSKEVKLKKDL